jgi:FlaA1/EpsC-like NDP-sugar epimerase
MNIIDIPKFIKEYITKREVSLFAADIEKNKSVLSQKIKGKSVLVIGGAGTIGSSYIKSLLVFEPSKLVVVDINENGLTELTRDLRSTTNQFIPDEYITYPMSFGDPVFEKMFLSHGPFHIVANFAAHKHVRSEKDQFSIEAMIENNVFKAKSFLDLLLKHKPEHFFCVSTDKAANPVNVMGASKKLMEEVIMAYSSEIQITTARFANVAFSNGSLLAGYIERLFKKQPISCPSDVKRFFVSPEESGQICMLACMLGESGQIFFPKLEEEEQVFFKDITIDFFHASDREIQLCNSEKEARQIAQELNESNPYPIYFFDSDTSGEKLYEEFYTEIDELDLNQFDSLGVIKNARKLPLEHIELCVSDLQSLMNSGNYNKQLIIESLKKHLPDFQHIETGKSLDQKM